MILIDNNAKNIVGYYDIETSRHLSMEGTPMGVIERLGVHSERS